MNHLRSKLLIAGVLLTLSVAYLSYAGVQKGWVYYLEVDPFVGGVQYQDQRVRLCGRVAEEGVNASKAHLTALFVIEGANERVPVLYRGVIPDLFKPGCEVVVEGQLDEAGVFQADVMLTKCASKYEAEDHAKRLEAKS
jgi:cytochrome c-type biogenesis protein CcmE